MMMKRISLGIALALALALPASAQSTKQQLIQLQTQVQALQDEMARMKESFNERMGIMRSLIEQTTDNINKMNSSMAGLERTIQQNLNEGGSRSEYVSEQVQALHDSVDEVKVRLNRLIQQFEELRAREAGMPLQGAAAAGEALPADVLYNNALRDYNAARYDLSLQQFREYLQHYPATELAGNAQFYLADILYRQGQFKEAVTEYDKVLEQYPGGNKAAAAQLKKGFALLEMGQRQAGQRELASLIQRYPRSIEATQARERLDKLGTPGAKPSPRRVQ